MFIKQRWKKWKLMVIGLFSLMWVIGFSGFGFAGEGEKLPSATKIDPATSPAKAKTPGKSLRDGGSDGVAWGEGVDLVVSKVELTKGVFAGERKIQIIPYIKNMWRGRTSSRIKILFDGLGMAEWIEGGIGPNEEKRGGAIYRSYDPTRTFTLRFSVEVDNNNEIPENNDLNNRCENITFSFSETHKIHNCPIVGPHEPLR